MSGENEAGIYLIVDFDWPKPFKPEYGQFARELHDAVQDQEWIAEILAGSGGIGAGRSSVWVFRLSNFGSLDRLFSSSSDAVGEAYRKFFASMENVEDKVREEVRFL